MRTRSESIEVTLRKRRILLACCLTRMEDARLLKCIMVREFVGGVRVPQRYTKRSEWDVSGQPQSFGIQTLQWMIVAHGEDEWHRTEMFTTIWIAGERETE